jgi:peptidoglycan/LPS O-acetylase OafA/YrhL
MRLSDFTQGRDNNFNLIRIIAALAVLVSHSFALAIGTGDAEPLRKVIGMTPGTIAVDVFFITSGFLVTGSLLVRKSAIEFAWARALRVFPALLVMLALTVFCLGVFFTTVPFQSYLTDPKTQVYMLKNASLFMGAAYNLPGVFEHNPYKNAVNGSLWTMPTELRMYAILASIWVLFRAVHTLRLMAFKVAIVSCAVVAGILHVAGHFYFPMTGHFADFTHLFFMFFCGAAFYVLKGHISVSQPIFWLAIVALALSVTDKSVFFVVYNLTIAYVLFFLAYIPSGVIRAFNRVGDYSYGVYIYAFPVQQSIAATVPGISVLSMLLISAAVTLVFAVLSWHLLEQHALGLKTHCVAYTRRLFGGRLSKV